MHFVKMEGVGNDFVVLEGPQVVTPELVRAWCDRRRGIGADGVLVVAPGSAGQIAMEYWNADGSPAEMCGNGLRCAARYAFDRGWTKTREFTVVTGAGERPCRVLKDGRVRASLGPVVVAGETTTVAGTRLRTARVGNPHAVVFVDDLATTPVVSLGPAIESDTAFPERTNVEFVQLAAPNQLRVRTWERGVGATLACGTGAAAAAAVAAHEGMVAAGPITVSQPGGDLVVEGDGGVVWLEGAADYVFEGDWTRTT
jgi:diaminopimelate epimerase